MYRFKKASLEDENLIFDWLNEPHMMEFWDNSQEHKNDIHNFIHGRKQHYFYGTAQYWIGCVDNHPFCFILTDEINPSQTDLTDVHRDNLSQSGKTIAIDFGIGNKQYLGKGLASDTLKSFMDFYRSSIDKDVDTFFIDPDVDNPRAIHVYEKAGFELLNEFDVADGAFEGKKNILMVKKC